MNDFLNNVKSKLPEGAQNAADQAINTAQDAAKDIAREKLPAGIDAVSDKVVELAGKAEEKFPQASGITEKVVDATAAVQGKVSEVLRDDTPSA